MLSHEDPCRTGVVEVTSQNHGFMVNADGIPVGEFESTHFSGNDATLEGMVHRGLPIFSCQYHPEFQSKPLKPHPLFASFVAAAYGHKTGQQAAVRVSTTTTA